MEGSEFVSVRNYATAIIHNYHHLHHTLPFQSTIIRKTRIPSPKNEKAIPTRLASFGVKPIHCASVNSVSLHPRVVYDAAIMLSW